MSIQDNFNREFEIVELTESESEFIQQQWWFYQALLGALGRGDARALARMISEIDNHCQDNKELFVRFIKRTCNNPQLISAAEQLFGTTPEYLN